MASIETGWTTTTNIEWHCETDPQPAIQEGTLEIRYRRIFGLFQWRFLLEIDDTTDLGGGGRWHFIVPEGTALSDVARGITDLDAPVMAVARRPHDASNPLLVFPGIATFGFGTPIEILWGGEFGIEISQLYFLAYFSPTTGVRFSATDPVTWRAGDQLVAGNFPEAFNL